MHIENPYSSLQKLTIPTRIQKLNFTANFSQTCSRVPFKAFYRCLRSIR